MLLKIKTPLERTFPMTPLKYLLCFLRVIFPTHLLASLKHLTLRNNFLHGDCQHNRKYINKYASSTQTIEPKTETICATHPTNIMATATFNHLRHAVCTATPSHSMDALSIGCRHAEETLQLERYKTPKYTSWKGAATAATPILFHNDENNQNATRYV